MLNDRYFLLYESSFVDWNVGSYWWRKIDTRLVRHVSQMFDPHALREIEDCFTRLSELNKDVRAIVLAGDGAHFR